MKILYVEDDPEAQAFVSRALRESGFVIDTAGDGETGFELASAGAYDVLILDVKLPGMSGFELLRRLRRAGVSVPVLFLTAQGEVADRIEGLELGADDYLAKPFSPRELTARVRAILRRTAGNGGPRAAGSGAWVHDEARCRITFKGKPLDLTRNEYRLLVALLASPGRVFNRDQLMTAAWDDPGAALDRTVDAHIKLLRAKLREAAPDADPIVTHRGLGYSLREEA
jgi:two-component system catabolic regulation response regulator CreB